MVNKVKFFRTQQGLSQAQLAEKSGVPQATISEIEANKHIPGVDIAIYLSRALGVTVTELFIP